MITIGNKRKGDTGIYVGRPSPLGNPFVIGKDGTREEVIAKYREWFYDYAVHTPRVQKELDRLVKLHALSGSLCLLCYCHPLACHADVIKEYLESVLQDKLLQEKDQI